MVFYRFLFYAESPEAPFPDDAAEYTAFSADVATPVAVDLTAGALATDQAVWTHLTEYAACQDLAEEARAIGAEVIRYASVRDPARGANLAVLTCRAFAAPQPVERQTWRIRIGPTGAQALREHPRLGIEFPKDSFAPGSTPCRHALGPPPRPVSRHHVRRAERSTCGRVQIGSGLLSISRRTHSSLSRSGIIRA